MLHLGGTGVTPGGTGVTPGGTGVTPGGTDTTHGGTVNFDSFCKYNYNLRKKVLRPYDHRIVYGIFNRPGVAGVVLQTPLSLINS